MHQICDPRLSLLSASIQVWWLLVLSLPSFFCSCSSVDPLNVVTSQALFSGLLLCSLVNVTLEWLHSLPSLCSMPVAHLVSYPTLHLSGPVTPGPYCYMHPQLPLRSLTHLPGRLILPQSILFPPLLSFSHCRIAIIFQLIYFFCPFLF